MTNRAVPFLVGTVAGAGAVAAGVASPESAEAQVQPAVQHDHAAGGTFGAFLNGDDSALIDALTERLMPGAPGKPGAHDAGVLNYIDLALAGAYADLQDFYRRGCEALHAHCQKAHGKSFVQLSAGKQDAVITSTCSWGPRRRSTLSTISTATISITAGWASS
jgi:gluconate 2-dehydrogenase gamma chain